MTGSDGSQAPRRLTARGAATKIRIVEAADQLMYERGVAATSLDDVRLASGTSKSQLYGHFARKDELVNDVIARRAGMVLEHQRRHLSGVASIRGLERWRDELVERNAALNGANGCPLGSLAHELVDVNPEQRHVISAHFDSWIVVLAGAIDGMKASGEVRPDADSRALANGLLAALQGGYLLAQTARDVYPMRVALDMAIDRVRAEAGGGASLATASARR